MKKKSALEKASVRSNSSVHKRAATAKRANAQYGLDDVCVCEVAEPVYAWVLALAEGVAAAAAVVA